MMQNLQNQAIDDQAVIQRIERMRPELLHAMLLEAGEKSLSLAIVAMNSQDIPGKSGHLSLVTEIIIELSGRLNQEHGGELVANLGRVYSWWIDAIFDANQKNQPEVLQVILKQMGDMRATWLELHRQTEAVGAPGT